MDQALGKIGRDAAIQQRRWVQDRFGELGLAHSAQEVARAVERLGKARIACAVAEKVRAHGERQIEALRRPVYDIQELVEERPDLQLAAQAIVAEQLLELVDQQQQVLFRREALALEDGRDGVWSARERGA